MVQRYTEYASEDVSEIGAWMERRIHYFGQPCITTQEYRAVVYSLYGLPDVKLIEGVVTIAIELPTQGYVAGKMSISQARVSQLLESAGKALVWFEENHVPGVGWTQDRRKGRGVAAWDFHAPVLAHPVPPEAKQQKARVEIVRPVDKVYGIYKLVFAGDL